MSVFNPMYQYVVELYSEGNDFPSDTLGEFFDTRDAAHEAALNELCRVDHMKRSRDYDPCLDWAVRYTLRRCYVPVGLRDRKWMR